MSQNQLGHVTPVGDRGHAKRLFLRRRILGAKEPTGGTVNAVSHLRISEPGIVDKPAWFCLSAGIGHESVKHKKATLIIRLLAQRSK